MLSDARLSYTLKQRQTESVEEIIRVIIIQRIKFILSANTTIQRFAILPELDVGQTRSNAAVTVCIEGIDVDGMTENDIAEADEVFEIGDGRYLIVEA